MNKIRYGEKVPSWMGAMLGLMTRILMLTSSGPGFVNGSVRENQQDILGLPRYEDLRYDFAWISTAVVACCRCSKFLVLSFPGPEWFSVGYLVALSTRIGWSSRHLIMLMSDSISPVIAWIHVHTSSHGLHCLMFPGKGDIKIWTCPEKVCHTAVWLGMLASDWCSENLLPFRRSPRVKTKKCCHPSLKR